MHDAGQSSINDEVEIIFFESNMSSACRCPSSEESEPGNEERKESLWWTGRRRGTSLGLRKRSVFYELERCSLPRQKRELNL